MADNSGSLGNLNLDLTGNVQPLKHALKDAEQAAKQTEKSMEGVSRAADEGMRQVAASTEEATKAAGGFLKSLSMVRETISKVFAPAAIAATIVAFVKRFEEASAAAEKFTGTLEEMLLAYQRIGEAQAKSIGLSPDEKSIDAIREAAVKAKEAIEAESTKAEADARGRGLGGVVWAWMTGGLSPDEMARQASEAVNKINQQAEANVARERERQRQERIRQNIEAEAEWAKNAMKEVEEYRKKIEQDRLDAIEDRKRAEAKDAEAEEARLKRLMEAQQKSLDAFNAHVSSAVSAARNQFDQMASNVGRLMEIAESQRLNGKH